MSKHMKRAEGMLRFALVALCGAFWIGAAPVAFSASTGSGVSSWVEEPDGPAQLGLSGTTLTVSFGAAPRPPEGSRMAVVLADYGVEQSPFSGNYAGAGIRAVRFRVSSTGHQPGKKVVILQGAVPDRTWQNASFLVPQAATQTVANLISFDRTEGWTTSYPGDAEEMWVEDINNVAAIGLLIMQGGRDGYDPQSYTIEDFVLVGEDGIPTPPASLTPAQRQNLMIRFGVLRFENVSGRQRASDTDADGMTDVNEILVGTDWGNARDKFAAQIVAGAPSITIRWRCAEGGIYRLHRADSLTGGFSGVAIGGQRELTPTAEEIATGYMVRRDDGATGGGPYFYRIVKK